MAHKGVYYLCYAQPSVWQLDRHRRGRVNRANRATNRIQH